MKHMSCSNSHHSEVCRHFGAMKVIALIVTELYYLHFSEWVKYVQVVLNYYDSS